MNRNEFITKVDEATRDDSIESVSSPVISFFPFYNVMTRASCLSAAFLTRVRTKQGTEHSVLVAYHENDGVPEYTVWCSDKFVEARGLEESEARERCVEAAKPYGVRGKTLESEMLSRYGSYAASDACNFWSKWRKEKQLCAHANAALAALNSQDSGFMAQLEQKFAQAGLSGQSAESALGLEEFAFRVPVLFEGDRGAGKTVTAREFARRNDCYTVELGGNEGIEATDMLGYLVPAPAGGMVWMDGPLAEAFRQAKTEKTVLIIDELLRIRQRELSILLTALSPDKGVYRLRTGRVLTVEDGVAKQEVLECPCENLFVVATTNVGAEYAVDEIDEALAERFLPIRKDTTVAELKRILGEVAKKREYSEKIVDKCVTFFTKMQELHNRGMMRSAPTTRTLVRALELAATESDVSRMLRAQHLLWVARDSSGRPVEAQIEDIDKLLERCFK